MALIKCPECRHDISDKASKCPNCGYPLNSESAERKDICTTISEASVNNNDDIKPESKRKLKKKIIIGIIIFILVLIVGVAAVLLNKVIFYNNLSISEISLSKWKLIDEGIYFDEYEGTVTSNETKPFVAVIGYYKEKDNVPKFVYMEDGKGTIKTMESSDGDPSIEYTAIGYMNGNKLKESDISSIICNDSDYYDWVSDTSCTINIDIEMKNKKNGLLFFDLNNDLTNDIERNIAVVITDGKGSYSYYLSDLPFKSRGVDVTVTPKFFCSCKELTETDYEVETPFSVEKEEGKYSTSFSGKEELTFNKYDNGMIIYTEKLLDGGRKEDRGKVVGKGAYLKDNHCTLWTYIYGDNDEKILTPSYEINVIGYLRWFTYDKVR